MFLRGQTGQSKPEMVMSEYVQTNIKALLFFPQTLWTQSRGQTVVKDINQRTFFKLCRQHPYFQATDWVYVQKMKSIRHRD